MVKLSLILIACFALMSCTESQSAHVISPVANSTPPPASTQSSPAFLNPVKPMLELSRRERRYLNESVPPDVREVLENAESFEILAEIDKDESSESDSRTFNPNRIASIPLDKIKKEILEAFYSDAAKEDSPAVCYEPHHSIRATHKGKTVEIEICFDCSRFFVKTGSGEDLRGTIVRDGRKSEDLFAKILKELGSELQK